MAYMSQEKKAKIAPVVKNILKQYGVKGSLAVRNHSTLVLNIKSGPIDFISNFNTVVNDIYHREHDSWKAETYIDVNPYHFQKHFSGKALEFLKKIFVAMNDGNHDRSDIQTDYFDVGWYVDVNIGRWNKPYNLEK